MVTENKPNRFAAFTKWLKHVSARDITQGIEGSWQRFITLIEKARETYYRLVIMDNETFAEIKSYKLSIFSFYVAISTLFVGFTALGMALAVFTPLKKIAFGYGGYGSERAIFDLSERSDSLERVINAHEVYISNFKKMLVGDVETEKDVPKVTTSPAALPDSSANTEPSEHELKIRASGNEPFDDNNANTNNAGKAIRVSIHNDRLESMFLQAPVAGTMSMPFSLEKKHYGVDITAPKNTPIKAVCDGFVISSDWTLETGNTIAIQHVNNVVSFYKHNSNLLKKVGDKVNTGEAIAIIGNTGEQTTGTHLHFELWKDGKAVNPQEYIRF